jgi:hypothetical protein
MVLLAGLVRLTWVLSGSQAPCMKKAPDRVVGGLVCADVPMQARHSPDRDRMITEIRIMEMGEVAVFMCFSCSSC